MNPSPIQGLEDRLKVWDLGVILQVSLPGGVQPNSDSEYRGTSPIRKQTSLRTYRRPMPRVLGGS